jgi:DNA repair protein RadA/Sms
MSKMNLKVGVKGLKRGTSLSDVKVPDALRDRKKTGIEWFDRALGGEGIAPSTVMMVTGTPGAGKSTLMLQLAESISKAGHIALYNTGEESIYQVKMVAERLGLKGDFAVGQDVMVEDVLAHADFLRKANPGKQVFILQDSLQTLDDGKYGNITNSMTPVRCTEMLTDWAKANTGVVMFVGQVTKDGEFAGKQTIKHAVDVHVHMYVDRAKKSETFGERIFEVSKNRFGVSGTTITFGINKRGLYEKDVLLGQEA